MHPGSIHPRRSFLKSVFWSRGVISCKSSTTLPVLNVLSSSLNHTVVASSTPRPSTSKDWVVRWVKRWKCFWRRTAIAICKAGTAWGAKGRGRFWVFSRMRWKEDTPVESGGGAPQGVRRYTAQRMPWTLVDVREWSVEDPFLHDFLRDLRPTYTAPGRYALSHSLLDSEAADVFLRETERLQEARLLTLLEDGWEGRLKRSVYGLVCAGIDMFPITGKIRSRLNYELHERARVAQKSKHRKHGHMHTMEAAGIDTDLAKDLDNPITWIPPLDGNDGEGDEDIVEKAAQDLQAVLNDEEPVVLPDGSVTNGQIVDFAELERIERGERAGIEEEEDEIVGGDGGDSWNVEDLMRS
ncbi:hypothetical protein C8R46DRAFT_1353469 [Mycena filopes]|nr:hypothetical protein C8R46DRAFT_1353469 [Mycena filopes]